jgi:beta-glucosidase
LAVPIIRRNVPGAQAGIVLNLTTAVPASPSSADAAAARLRDGIVNRWFIDPVAGCGYPEDVVQHYGRPIPFVEAGDLDTIAVPVDFLGANYYFRTIVRSDGVPESENEPRTVFPNAERTEMGWEVCPEGFRDILVRLHEDYRFPAIYVTENGAAYRDEIGPDGRVEDPKRIAYLRGHLKAVAQAVAAGVPLRGYFVWSLMDNFEWAHGYTRRFGIVYMDYATQRRIPKGSAHWYRSVMDSGGVVK